MMTVQDALAIAANPTESTDEQIAEAYDVIAEEAQRLGASATAEDLDALEALVEAGAILQSTTQAREADRVDRGARAADLLGRIGLSVGTPDPDADTDTDTAADDDVTAPDTIEGIDDTPPAVDPANAPAPGTAPVPAAASAAPVVAAGKPAAPASTFAAARRKVVRPEPTAPAAFAYNELPGRFGPDGAIHDFGQFADSVIKAAEKNRPRQTIWSDGAMERAEYAEYGGGRTVPLARFATRWGNQPVRKLGEDPIANGTVLDDLRKDTLRQAAQAVTAAGGCPCAPYPVDYSIFDLVEPYNPIEADIPAVDMPRGGIRYMECLDYRDYASGTAVRTCADENQAEETYVQKPCVRITCPDELSTSPLIIPACLTVANFVQNTYPELVKQALSWLGTLYEDLKQVAYADAIRTEAIAGTNYTAASVYGAAREYFNTLARALWGYRARRHMRPDSPLQIMVPYFLPGILAEDVRNNAYEGLSFGAGVADYDAWFRGELRKLNVTATYWYLKPTGVAANKWIDRAQTDAAALNTWPTTIETVIVAPGVWNRGVIADIDFGLVVDSPLIRTNDAMFFMETMFAVFSRCSTATELMTSTLCANGVPGPVAAVASSCP